MKTAEERQAEREERLRTNIAGPRTGYIPRTAEAPPEPSPVIKGLELSVVDFWPVEKFKPHPANHVFEQSKTDAYWRDLRRDILEAGAIINPVIALPDGTLLEGHSRIRIARELKADGNDLGRIPVRIVSSSISPEEAERRVYLGNLSRFELDDDTRLTLQAKVWPDFYGKEGKAGRPGKSGHDVPIIAREISEQVGKSEKQVKRDRAIVVKAKKIAKKKGKSGPDTEDIREAREKKAAAQRRARAKAPANRVRLELSRAEAEGALRVLRGSRAAAVQTLARKIEKALR